MQYIHNIIHQFYSLLHGITRLGFGSYTADLSSPPSYVSNSSESRRDSPSAMEAVADDPVPHCRGGKCRFLAAPATYP